MGGDNVCLGPCHGLPKVAVGQEYLGECLLNRFTNKTIACDIVLVFIDDRRAPMHFKRAKNLCTSV